MLTSRQQQERNYVTSFCFLLHQLLRRTLVRSFFMESIIHPHRCHVQTLWSAPRHLSSGLGSQFRFHGINHPRYVIICEDWIVLTTI